MYMCLHAVFWIGGSSSHEILSGVHDSRLQTIASPGIKLFHMNTGNLYNSGGRVLLGQCDITMGCVYVKFISYQFIIFMTQANPPSCFKMCAQFCQ